MLLKARPHAGATPTSPAPPRQERSPDPSRRPPNASKDRATAGRKMRQMPRDDPEPTRRHLTHPGSRWRAWGAHHAPPAARGSPGSGPGSGTARAAVGNARTTARTGQRPRYEGRGTPTTSSARPASDGPPLPPRPTPQHLRSRRIESPGGRRPRCGARASRGPPSSAPPHDPHVTRSIVTDPAELACLLARLQQATDELPAGAMPALVAQLAALAMQAAGRMAGGAAAQPPRVPPAERQQDLTQEEAATVFNIPLRTVRFLSRTKRIASYKRRRNRMLRPADVAAYIEKCRETGVALTVYHGVTMRRDPRGDAAHPRDARTHPGGVRRTARRDPGDRRAMGDGTGQGPAHG